MKLFREINYHIRQFPNVFWLVITATLINQIGNMAFVFFLLYLTQYLGLNLGEAAFIFSLLAMSMLFTGLIAGGFIDKFGFARTLTGSFLLNGIVLLVFPFIKIKSLVMIMCVIWGFSYGLYRPAAQTFVSHLSKPGTNKITFSVFRLSLNLGMSIGPMLGGYLATRSFVTLFLVNGLTNLSASLLLIVGLMHTSWFSYRNNTQKKVELGISILKKDPLLRLFMLGMVPISMVFFQHESTLAIFLHDDLNLPLSFYGFLFTLNTLLIVCFELPLNVATMHWSYRTNFILGSLLITLAFAALCFAQQQWFVIGVAIVWTLGEMILYPAASSFIADIAPIENRGNYMSLFSTCSNLGFLLGPWAGALIMGHYGASKLWIICGIWGALSIIIFQIIKHNNQYSDRFV